MRPSSDSYLSNAHVWRGVTFLVVGMFLGTTIDIAVKALTSSYTTPQIVLVRSLIAIPFMLLVCRQQGDLAALMAPRWGWQLYRGTMVAGATFGFFYGLAHVELVTAMMLGYIAPVLMVLMARPLLGERVGFHQWCGVLIAFVGVVTVLQPTALDLDPAALLRNNRWFLGGRLGWAKAEAEGAGLGALAILGSAVCWALVSISNRRLSTEIRPGVLAFYTLPVGVVIAAVLTWGDWPRPSGFEWVLFAIAGIASTGVHYCFAVAYRHAAVATLAPLEYSSLLWGALAGYLFWNELPSVWIWLGGCAVIVGGSIALRGRG